MLYFKSIDVELMWCAKAYNIIGMISSSNCKASIVIQIPLIGVVPVLSYFNVPLC